VIEYLDRDDLVKIARHAIGEDDAIEDYGLLESALRFPSLR
jgi:death-on-curing protein